MGEVEADEVLGEGALSGVMGSGRRDISGDLGRRAFSGVVTVSGFRRCDTGLVGVDGRLVTVGRETVCDCTTEVGGVAVGVAVAPSPLFRVTLLRGRGFGTTGCDEAAVGSSLYGFSTGWGGLAEGLGLLLGLGLATGRIFRLSDDDEGAASGRVSGVPFLLFLLWVGKGGWLFMFSYTGLSVVVSWGASGGELLWAEEGVGLRLCVAAVGALVSRFM